MSPDQAMPLTQSVYLRHTDKQGHVSVHEHYSWNVAGFLAGQHAAAAEAGGKSKVEQLTQEQYRALRWPKRAEAGK